jgi:WD40 repeat protein
MAWLTFIAARPGGDLLAVSSSEGWVGVWLPMDNRIVASHKLGGTVNKLGWTTDGAYLLVTQSDRLMVFSQDGTELVREIPTGHGSLRTFAAHPTQPIVATTGISASVKTWDVTTGAHVLTVLAEEGNGSGGGTAVALSETTVVVGYESGYYATCDPDGKNVGLKQMFGGAAVYSMAAIPNTTSFIAGGGAGKTMHLIIEPTTLQVKHVWDDPPRPIAANTVDVGPNGSFVVAASDNCARVYKNVDDSFGSTLGRPFYLDKKPWEQQYIVSAACFVPKTKLVATSHFGGYVKLWHEYREVEVRFVDDQPQWSRDGKPIENPIAKWPELPYD